ncbi:polyprenyl synthetase [Mycolicibacterium phlei]|uniref:Polyprenyl synthetase n=1 Tax=Mycolicibacterium phlei DSM 43239 = CCUG 21000 TaxID=1226750 RepID=A0A5N5V892_MYCPH|nr:(2E,6E)-farnesyl diphosphate synthase [Mycolicibacterium phlei]EID12467.1 polyprenyl synthetase [Mycolicibacterium phlei RIVM601174]KAB7756850.1 polyprenyl synthetase [Mycolicibacterium phlei DSM 43239 = CCUG 21000]KXW69351.1 polyprenyl synthetase [Mycolicibacterium phlei DSM 43072]KXW72806.1 polyprenyl synthetase [Mycolicibacterium phlei DSM 43070]KXW78128.1 polyprenyl synthetase [Mycolicibacterium phlei DSM 43071]VEG08986.1 polyprenyl synthetase [Mycobacteroides chelonae]
MSGINGHTSAPVLAQRDLLAAPFPVWRDTLRRAVLDALTGFVDNRCTADLGPAGVDVAPRMLRLLVDGGKCLRSTFLYLGWRCDADDDTGAVRAAASFELLHAFALLQDDVMDGSALRRGRPAAHVIFAQWHRDRTLSGPADRFGEAAAVLLGDLCLVWAEQMLRESGLSAAALGRAWPRYDAMRTELAVGQFADLVNDAAEFPDWDRVLDVLRRKSGNYTVRRPLEIGAAMAGCSPAVMQMLGEYGAAVGEAFQLRDDVLGIFGSPEVTGKPAGSDLTEHKATSVVVAAHRLADSAVRRELAELMRTADLGDADIDRWRSLIVSTGAVEYVERLIDSRRSRALELLSDSPLDATLSTALAETATACCDRAA